MRYWKCFVLVLFLQGVKSQAGRAASIQKDVKPVVYWATSVNSNNNRRFQQADEWNAVHPNYLDRQWAAPTPPPQPPAPPAYQPPPPPEPTTPAPPIYQPPPPTQPPAPPAYQPPPVYPDPAPPTYPDPAPPTYPDPAPPTYPDPYPPTYDPPAPPAYDSRVPQYAPAPSPPGYYYPYHYYPVKESKGPTIKDLLSKEKEALEILMSNGHKKELNYAQKVWLSVLTPLIIVSLIVPLSAILLSGFTITTNKRAFGELDLDVMKKHIMEIGQRYVSVVESEECMQRIICDLGSYATGIPGKSYIFALLASFVPDTMKNNMAIFQKAANYGAEKAHCSSFKCSAWKF